MEAKITLTYNTDTRSLRVDGSIADRMVALGMLEMAKDVVSDFHNKLSQEQIDKINAGVKK